MAIPQIFFSTDLQQIEKRINLTCNLPAMFSVRLTALPIKQPTCTDLWPNHEANRDFKMLLVKHRLLPSMAVILINGPCLPVCSADQSQHIKDQVWQIKMHI